MWHMHVIVGHIWIVLKYWFLPIAETTWNTVYFKGDTDLATAPDFSSAPFVPMASEWRTDSIDMTSYLGADFLSIAFRNHGNWSQMLYVDNINLGDQAVAMEAAPLKEWVSCYPNPVAANGQLKISSSTDAPVEFSLFNLKWKTYFSSAYKWKRPHKYRQASAEHGNLFISCKREWHHAQWKIDSCENALVNRAYASGGSYFKQAKSSHICIQYPPY